MHENTCAILTIMGYRVVCPKIIKLSHKIILIFRNKIFAIYGITVLISIKLSIHLQTYGTMGIQKISIPYPIATADAANPPTIPFRASE